MCSLSLMQQNTGSGRQPAGIPFDVGQPAVGLHTVTPIPWLLDGAFEHVLH
jgi:hypothetical protein